MACCFIAAFCIGQLVKACQFFDLDDSIDYNDDTGTEAVPETESGHARTASVKSCNSNAIILSLSGMSCAACSSSIERAILGFDGVKDVRVSLHLQQATVVGANSTLDLDGILQAVRELGYGAEPGPRSPKEMMGLLESRRESKMLWTSFANVGKHAAVIQLLEMATYQIRGTSTLEIIVLWALQVAALAVAVSCQWRHVSWMHADGWRWIKGASPTMNTLVALAVFLGISFSCIDLLIQGPRAATMYLTTCTGLTLTVVGGRYLECLSRRQVSKDLIKIYKPLTDSDFVRLSPSGENVPSTYLRPSDEIFVEPFSTIPCDCYITSGSSLVNQSMLTGESLPVRRDVGDIIMGGTRNFHGRLVCAVKSEKGQSFYSKLLESVAESSATKSDSDALLDDIIKYFVTAVIFFAIVLPILEVFRLNLLRPNYQDIRFAVARSMTILMSACPCALGLAIPSAVAAAVYSAQKRGLLITGGASTIQNLAKVKSVIFDKTGTLTGDHLAVSDFLPSPKWACRENTLWTLVCAAEVNDATGHPVGKSIFSSGVKSLGEDWLHFQAFAETRDICSSAGQGVSGNIRVAQNEWHHVIVGSSQYLRAAGIKDIPDHDKTVGSGKIEAHIGVDGCYAGKILVSDTVKAEAQSTIAALISSGYQCSLLTGDMAAEAHRVASHVGIPVLASQASPTDKLAVINASKKNGNVVAMVGDGLNDAPSLAAADVGFAMYHNNALATTGASVMILNSRIDLVCLAFKIAELTNQQITFNLRWTAAYNLLAFVMAVGWIEPFGFAMTPSVAAAMMSTSSIFITAQSFRLRTRLDNLP
ncbi:heavy metal translocating P-type ATPase [Colletotrichum asianum]|uniref:Heavy metal translocating P-type ATPase n=1 Tax=Colletotrichum asianum TaxID=702518 RepID=A0A8H3WRE7_9PEZI|nr:heavy metal translocating P-type ATPase [Colletotrichum asianum]